MVQTVIPNETFTSLYRGYVLMVRLYNQSIIITLNHPNVSETIPGYLIGSIHIEDKNMNDMSLEYITRCLDDIIKDEETKKNKVIISEKYQDIKKRFSIKN